MRDEAMPADPVFQIGQVVKLTACARPMTVTNYKPRAEFASGLTHRAEADVAWFDDAGNLQELHLYAAALMPVFEEPTSDVRP